MLPINNSDTAWLIVADFNQDNDIGYPDCLRDDIRNPDVNDGDSEYNYSLRVGSDYECRHPLSNKIGGSYFYGRGVGTDEGVYVGGGVAISIFVGGNDPY